jgi:hypothetical protein
MSGTWLSIGDDIRVIANDLQLNCAEYGLKAWFAPSKSSRSLALEIQPICNKYSMKYSMSILKMHSIMKFSSVKIQVFWI